MYVKYRSRVKLCERRPRRRCVARARATTLHRHCTGANGIKDAHDASTHQGGRAGDAQPHSRRGGTGIQPPRRVAPVARGHRRRGRRDARRDLLALPQQGRSLRRDARARDARRWRRWSGARATTRHSDPLGYVRRCMVTVLRKTTDDAQTRRVFEIVCHKCEYVDEMAKVRDRYVEMRADCLRRSSAASATRPPRPPARRRECAQRRGRAARARRRA